MLDREKLRKKVRVSVAHDSTGLGSTYMLVKYEGMSERVSTDVPTEDFMSRSTSTA